MATRLRVLGTSDLPETLALLERQPVHNLFLTSRIAQFGLEPMLLGTEVLGFERDGRLTAICHHGANLVPAGRDEGAVDAFVDAIGRHRRSSSIMGPASLVRPLYEGLCRQWGGSWARTREVRPTQPLMVIDHEPCVAPDSSVRRMRPDELEPYFAAAVAMYTEEVGVSPLDGSNSYRGYVARVIAAGRAFGVVSGDRVAFKSDIGSAHGDACQVQGVWLAPDLRGRGLSAPAMAAVVQLCREQYRVVSLYVNDFNTRARRLYETVGFRTVDEFATVLY